MKTNSVIRFNRRYFLAFLAFFAVETAIALFVRDYFIRPYVGDALVVILLYCLARSFVRTKTAHLPIAVFLFAALVELAQKLDLLGLLGLQSNRFLRIILGVTYDFNDILCYLAGAVLLLLWELFAAKKT